MISLLWTPRHLPYIFTDVLCKEHWVSAARSIFFGHCQQREAAVLSFRELSHTVTACLRSAGSKGREDRHESQFQNSQPPRVEQRLSK